MLMLCVYKLESNFFNIELRSFFGSRITQPGISLNLIVLFVSEIEVLVLALPKNVVIRAE